MKRSYKILIILASILLLLFLWGTWYKAKYGMEIAQSFQVYSPEMDRSLLIATQGSAFKDSITQEIIKHYNKDSIFIKVIDVSLLSEINPEDYKAIHLMHTWENWKPPYVVKQFIENNKKYLQKMVVLTTSGEGTYQMIEVDAITGESNLEEIPVFVANIIKKLKKIPGF